ncbi:MAG: histidine kinase [Micropruina sp.]
MLAATLTVLTIAVDGGREEQAPVVLSLAACLAVALIPWWPRSAGLALAVILGLQLALPVSVALGVGVAFAPFVAILCSTARERSLVQLSMSLGYGALFVAILHQRTLGTMPWLIAIGTTAMLIAVAWVIGTALGAGQSALNRVRAAELQRQRLVVARELHDTVARELTRASLQAQSALQQHPSAQLEGVVAHIQQASAQLRWILALLRDSDEAPHADRSGGSPSEALAAATARLEAQGFTVIATVDGELDAVPPALVPTLRAVIDEACANIERHGDRSRPCVIIVSIAGVGVDAVFINDSRSDHTPGGPGVGLIGVRERLTLIGGELAVEQNGSQWICRIAIPF